MNLKAAAQKYGRSFALVLFITVYLGSYQATHAAPGDLDPSFDGDGKVVTFVGTGGDLVRAMVIQPDGRIVVAGNSAGNLALVRYNPDGSLDNSFDTDGKVITIIPDAASRAHALVFQPDGKIIAAGAVAVAGKQNWILVRYNTDGTLDTAFDADGIVVTSFGDISDVASGVAIQTDGKIVVAGNTITEGGATSAFALARYNSDGSLDNSFDTDGKVITNFAAASSDAAGDVEIQADGKILAIGSSNVTSAVLALARYNPDGSLDNTFDSDGKVTTQISKSDNGRALIIQPDGKIIAAANLVPFSTALVRYNPDGSPDTTFGADGIVVDSTGIFSVGGAALQADGKIIVGGSIFTSLFSFGLSRRHADGSLDAAFGTGGRVATIMGTFSSGVAAVVIQADGKIVAAGTSSDSGQSSGFAVARYLAATGYRAPYDFDGDNKTDIGVFRPADGSWWYARSLDNAVRVFSFGAPTDTITPGDFTGDGKADPAVFRPSTGEWFVQRSEDNSFFSFPFGTNGDIPAPADFNGDGKTDAAVFRPATGTWFILNSGGGGTSIVQFGSEGDEPVPADYDGDGKADIAIFRPSDGSWWYLQSTNQQFRVYRFGLGTDKPVVGDYTGDGKAELAIFRPSTGEWYFQRSEDNSYFSVPFGGAGDIPAPGDYDGDGRFDTAVFRPSTADWYVQRSTAGILITTFGAAGDRPIPNAFIP